VGAKFLILSECSQDRFFVMIQEFLGELDIEFKPHISFYFLFSTLKLVLAVLKNIIRRANWHTFTLGNQNAGLRSNTLIRQNAQSASIESCDLNWFWVESIFEADGCLVGKILALSAPL